MSLSAQVYKEILQLQNEIADAKKEQMRLQGLVKECEIRISVNTNKIADFQYANTLLKEAFATVFTSAHKPDDGIRFPANTAYTTSSVRDASRYIASHFGYDLKLEGTTYVITLKVPQEQSDERDAAMQALSTPAEEIGQGDSERVCPLCKISMFDCLCSSTKLSR
jgi:hypothetical protein